MKNLVWLCLCFVLVVPATGQRGGGFGGTGRSAGSGLGHAGFGSRAFRPGSFGRGRFRSALVFGRFNRFGLRFSPYGSSFYPYSYPLFDGGYDYGYPSDYGYPATPNVFMIPQPTPQMIVQQPAHEVIRPEIREYRESLSAVSEAPPAARSEETTFVIVLNDGSHHAANAVWVQGTILHYVDSEDDHHQVPLTSVDRATTRELNRERKLNLWLPPAQ
jgi:hypothetical protein